MICSIRMMVMPCSSLSRTSNARMSSTSPCDKPAILIAMSNRGSAAMARAIPACAFQSESDPRQPVRLGHQPDHSSSAIHRYRSPARRRLDAPAQLQDWNAQILREVSGRTAAATETSRKTEPRPLVPAYIQPACPRNEPTRTRCATFRTGNLTSVLCRPIGTISPIRSP